MSDSYTTVKVDETLTKCDEIVLHLNAYQKAQDDKTVWAHIVVNSQPKKKWVKWFKRVQYVPHVMSYEEACTSLDEIYSEYWNGKWKNESCNSELSMVESIRSLCENSITGEIEISSTHNKVLTTKYSIWIYPEGLKEHLEQGTWKRPE